VERSRSQERKDKASRVVVQESPSNSVKADEKEMGLIFVRPEHDKVLFKPLEATDPVFEKYL